MYTWARTGTRKELVDKLNNGEQKKYEVRNIRKTSKQTRMEDNQVLEV